MYSIRWFIKRLHGKINRNEVNRGRKDSGEYISAMYHAKRLVNSNAVIRESALPFELRKRFAHKIYGKNDF